MPKVTKLNPIPKHVPLYVDNTKRMVQYIQSTPYFSEDDRKPYKCWWCDLSVDHALLGCPIKRIPSYKWRKVWSRDKSDYTLVSVQDKNQGEYLTEGVFCSFNCIKGYLQDHRLDDRYKDGPRLLSSMYVEITGNVVPVNIPPAPHKGIMIPYGGTMTEEQYRESVGRVVFDSVGSISLQPISNLYEET